MTHFRCWHRGTQEIDLIFGSFAGRYAYLVPAAGAVEINGVRIGARDGAAIADVEALAVTALEDTEIVMVDAA